MFQVQKPSTTKQESTTLTTTQQNDPGVHSTEDLGTIETVADSDNDNKDCSNKDGDIKHVGPVSDQIKKNLSNVQHATKTVSDHAEDKINAVSGQSQNDNKV